MPTQSDVVKIASALPGASKAPDYFSFAVEQRRGKPKGFAWVWLERIDPRKARVPQPKVLAVRVANEVEKAALLDADPDVFFTEAHYNGYPAVLVRLEAITLPALRHVLTEAWRCVAPADKPAATIKPAAKPPARTPAKAKPAAKPPARTPAKTKPAAEPPARKPAARKPAKRATASR